MRRELIVGFLIGGMLGGLVDFLARSHGLGVIGGALTGAFVGFWLVPASLRAMLTPKDGDGGGDGFVGDIGGGHGGDCGSSDGGGCH